jgi:transcriptional regulator with XRE-family HTH domain
MDRPAAFAETLRRHRRAARLTQGELAERAHLSERAISDLERGLNVPQRTTVRTLAEALALPADQAQLFSLAARGHAQSRDGSATGVATQTLAAEVAAASSPDQHEGARRLTNLQVQRARLIGRARDATALCQILLDEDGCLVTLVGPGGVGKTRLGIEVEVEVDEFTVTPSGKIQKFVLRDRFVAESRRATIAGKIDAKPAGI